MEQLRQTFIGLQVFKSMVYDFARKHYNLTLKKARFQSVDRNSEEKTKNAWIGFGNGIKPIWILRETRSFSMNLPFILT